MSNVFTSLRRRWQFGSAIIVVTGLPRSGTSMVMRMLQAGGVEVVTDGERRADADNPLGYFEVERVKRLQQEQDKSWLSHSRGKAIKVISHLLQSLPHDNYYKVILCERDLGEVLTSQNVMLQRREQVNPIDDSEARAHYERHLAHIRIFMKVKRNMEFLPVRYDEAISNPRAFAQRLNQFLGGRLHVERMVEVVDSKLYRNRKEHAAPAAQVSLSLVMLVAALGAGLFVAPDTAHAYVGPGAGFALVGSFLALLAAVASSIVSMLLWPIRSVLRWRRRRKAMSRASARRVVVLGLDGLDPTLAERWMAEGHLPNLSALAKDGTFTRLGTTYPAISPVAWSSFMTGVDPARHNIFDFLDRDVRTYKPRLSSSDIRPASRTMRVGDWLIPLGRPTINNMRKSKAFWRILGEHGIPANVLRVPLTFPPEKFAGALLSAMCVPDLRGTQGSFTYYTTSDAKPSEADAAPEQTGGERRRIAIDRGIVRASLAGPDNPLRAAAQPLEIPFEISAIDTAKKTCLLTIGRKKYPLREREYSPWIRLDFKAGFGVAVRGIARFYVTSMQPDFNLYVTPINIDPGKPALPISWPRIYSIYLSKLLGDFATLGLAEDTWALNEGVIDEQAFLQQALDHHAERERMFFNALEKSRDGAVVCVFDGTDRLQHMFFRYLDAKHPANRGRDTEQFRDTILQMYQRCDEMIGRVQRMLGPRDQFMVISDHGFQSFRRGINLNSWLHQHGLLHLDPTKPAGGDWFANVDWSRTKAYALGLSGLFINQRGREAHGIVEPGQETEAVKRQIIEGLTGLRDVAAGEASINAVFDPAQVHSKGPYGGNGPDLIIGYNRGYRASWEGAVGRVTDEVFIDNTKAWSGDHCIDPRLVPGVLFSNWRMPDGEPQIQDLAPTILAMFGVGKPDHMTGRVLPVQAPAAV
jgi:predicted AlkP superfamily phosphohydrolase/phosphomutase